MALDGTQDSQVGPASCQPAAARSASVVPISGLAVIPHRWVVERSLGWLAAHRRLTRDYERDPAVSEP